MFADIYQKAGGGSGPPSGSGGRRLANPAESSSTANGTTGTGRDGGLRGDSTGNGVGGENSVGSRRGSSKEGTAADATAASGKNKSEGSASATRRSSSTSPFANGDGKGDSAGDGRDDCGERSKASALGESGEEEGEVVFSSRKADGGSNVADAKLLDVDNKSNGGGGGSGGRSPRSATSDVRQNSPSPGISDSGSPGGRRNGVHSGGDGGEGGGIGSVTDAPKKVAKDRWADSDSDDEEGGGGPAGGGGVKGEGAIGEAAGSTKINGTLKGGDGLHAGELPGEAGSSLLAGDRKEGRAGIEGGGPEQAAVDDLHRAMAGDKKVRRVVVLKTFQSFLLPSVLQDA